MNPRASRLDWLRDRHRGERCVIVANGPSLNAMDLAPLRRETVIGLNKIHLGLPRFGFHPRYLVAVNPKVLSQSAREIAEMACVKFLAEGAARAAGFEEDALTYFIDTGNTARRFSGDLARGIHEGWTVTHCALQIAYFLGFTDVLLIGLDHRYEYQGDPNQANLLAGDDPNHFDPRYFAGQTWDNPDLAQSEASYRSALEAFQADGRRLRDATPGGACTVFPKVDFAEALA